MIQPHLPETDGHEIIADIDLSIPVDLRNPAADAAVAHCRAALPHYLRALLFCSAATERITLRYSGPLQEKDLLDLEDALGHLDCITNAFVPYAIPYHDQDGRTATFTSNVGKDYTHLAPQTRTRAFQTIREALEEIVPPQQAERLLRLLEDHLDDNPSE